MGIAHFKFLARAFGAFAVAATFGAAAPALAGVPSTDCQTLPANTCLGDPLAVAAPAWLGSPASPEEDPSAVLADLKAAPAPTAAPPPPRPRPRPRPRAGDHRGRHAPRRRRRPSCRRRRELLRPQGVCRHPALEHEH